MNYRIGRDGVRAWVEATGTGDLAERHARAFRAVVNAAKGHSFTPTDKTLARLLARTRHLCAIESEIGRRKRQAAFAPIPTPEETPTTDT